MRRPNVFPVLLALSIAAQVAAQVLSPSLTTQPSIVLSIFSSIALAVNSQGPTAPSAAGGAVTLAPSSPPSSSGLIHDSTARATTSPLNALETSSMDLVLAFALPLPTSPATTASPPPFVFAWPSTHPTTPLTSPSPSPLPMSPSLLAQSPTSPRYPHAVITIAPTTTSKAKPWASTPTPQPAPPRVVCPAGYKPQTGAQAVVSSSSVPGPGPYAKTGSVISPSTTGPCPSSGTTSSSSLGLDVATFSTGVSSTMGLGGSTAGSTSAAGYAGTTTTRGGASSSAVISSVVGGYTGAADAHGVGRGVFLAGLVVGWVEVFGGLV